MKINPDVKKAIEEGKPVVALESTIISHGMPYPKNVECALAVEKVIRENGAIPATIGIIDGEPIIGMSPDEIELFGKRKGILKASRRDLPVIMSKKLWGATTVATTMILAHEAGIEVFVTGFSGDWTWKMYFPVYQGIYLRYQRFQDIRQYETGSVPSCAESERRFL